MSVTYRLTCKEINLLQRNEFQICRECADPFLTLNDLEMQQPNVTIQQV